MRLLGRAEIQDAQDGTRPLRKKKIAIVGTGQSWPLAPFAFVDEWDIWTCNFYYDRMPRITTLLEIHSDASLARDPSLAPDGPMPDGVLGHKRRLAALVQQGIRVYMYPDREDPAVPGSLAYPFRDILARFHRRYFTSWVPYAIALAIYEGAEAIGFWGIDLNAREYIEHRPCIEYWIGRAEGLGITVTTPPESTTSLFYQPGGCLYHELPEGATFRQESPLRAAHALERIAYLRTHEQALTLALAETRGKRLEWEELVKALEATERGLTVPWEGRMGIEWKAQT